MRPFLLVVQSVLICACVTVGPPTPPVPITSHAVSAADYPPESMLAQEQGIAALRFVVTEDGSIDDIQVVRSSGFSRLDQAAVTMVQSRWRYQPATANGRPVRERISANVAFVLNPAWVYPLGFDAPEGSDAQINLSPKARALVEPVYAAYRRVEQRQSVFPPPTDDVERLIRLGEIDRSGRTAYTTIDLSPLEPTQRAAAFRAVRNEILRHDLANQAALRAMLPADGWFLKSRYGQGAVQAAFDIVYHALNDDELQRTVLAAIEALVTRGEISARAYAMLYDRVASQEGRPQRYGNEMICQDQRWVPAPLENAEQANLLRTTIGFPLTMEQYAASFRNAPPCS